MTTEARCSTTVVLIAGGVFLAAYLLAAWAGPWRLQRLGRDLLGVPHPNTGPGEHWKNGESRR